MNILQVSTLEQLRTINLPKSWAFLSKARIKEPNAPLFKLLDSAGGNTLAECAYILLHGRTVCKICSRNTVFRGKSGFSTYCSRNCVSLDSDLQKSNKAKREQTMLDKYGARGTLGSSHLRAKVYETTEERYGSRFASKNDNVKAKKRSTMIERFGGSSPNADASIKQKQSKTQRANANTRKLRFAESLGFTLTDGNILDDEHSTWLCAKGHSFQHRWLTAQAAPVCRECTPYIGGTSKYEQELADYVRSLCEVQTNYRLYTSARSYREIDILTNKGVGFEFNGLYWHSELAGKGRNYHLEKLELFESAGIHLVQIFEQEWIYKQQICKSVIQAKLGLSQYKLGARSLKLRPVPYDKAVEFFEKTHLSGNAKFKFALGLYQNDVLLCCSSWGSDRFGRSNQIELIRFSTELGFSISGGLSRLTAQVLRDHPGCTLKSFCDRRYGTGAGYISAGWELTRKTPPGYWYFDKNNVYHRLNFQKKKLIELTKSVGTEWELAQKYGLNRFWDCGNLVFTKV